MAVLGNAIWPIVDISLTGICVKIGGTVEIPSFPMRMVLKWGSVSLRTEVRLAWQEGERAGLVFTDTTGESLLRMRTLIEPLALGRSLGRVGASATMGSEAGKIWFHGQQDLNLWMWQMSHSSYLHKWILQYSHQIYTWTKDKGLELRSYSPAGWSQMTPGEGVAHRANAQLPWLRDLFWAVVDPVSVDLLATLDDTDHQV
jgi:hypothetical protein